MKGRVLIVGLDCLGAELLAPQSLSSLPNLRTLVETGISGPLQSTLPPITVPAWTSMVSGRDPGELGIYGFRNRRSFDYGDLVSATSQMVRYSRIWDIVGEGGGHSVVVGLPQTHPPPTIKGELIAGFESEGTSHPYTHPPELADEVREIVGEYQFDVKDFRTRRPEDVIDQVYSMTKKRFRITKHLLESRDWNFAMVCEIGPDRLHHCFWSSHDPAHPRYMNDSPHRSTIREYYRFLDVELGELLDVAGADATVVVASDHGAQPMLGGVCINEVLRKAGWLVLKEDPAEPVSLTPDMVDWANTRAWGEGGYYARIFLNVKGREPQGTIPAARRDEARNEIEALLESIPLDDGPLLLNQVVRPEKIYRRVRGIAPDLLVFFNELTWRSLGSVGHGRTWLVGNDTGLDEANHSRDGLFVISGRGVGRRGSMQASILDIAPTVLRLMTLPVPEDLFGRNLMDVPD